MPKYQGPQTRTITALQCICCGHVEAPAENLFHCVRCNGLDTRVCLVELVEEDEGREVQTLDIRPFVR